MKDQFVVEIKSAEGGDDSKLLVRDMLDIYVSACKVEGFPIFDIQKFESRATIQLSTKEAYNFFIQETGGHRWQRIPPTETRGRVHTSTVTVSVTAMDDGPEVEILYSDVEKFYTRGTGPGGQHRNKTSSCVHLHHIPTGIRVKVDGRDQRKNEEMAWKELTRRLVESESEKLSNERSAQKKEQVGCGMRGDKRRTYRTKDDRVVDHVSNRKSSLKKVLKGDISSLHSE